MEACKIKSVELIVPANKIHPHEIQGYLYFESDGVSTRLDIRCDIEKFVFLDKATKFFVRQLKLLFDNKVKNTEKINDFVETISHLRKACRV